MHLFTCILSFDLLCLPQSKVIHSFVRSFVHRLNFGLWCNPDPACIFFLYNYFFRIGSVAPLMKGRVGEIVIPLSNHRQILSYHVLRYERSALLFCFCPRLCVLFVFTAEVERDLTPLAKHAPQKFSEKLKTLVQLIGTFCRILRSSIKVLCWCS